MKCNFCMYIKKSWQIFPWLYKALIHSFKPEEEYLDVPPYIMSCQTGFQSIYLDLVTVQKSVQWYKLIFKNAYTWDRSSNFNSGCWFYWGMKNLFYFPRVRGLRLGIKNSFLLGVGGYTPPNWSSLFNLASQSLSIAIRHRLSCAILLELYSSNSPTPGNTFPRISYNSSPHESCNKIIRGT